MRHAVLNVDEEMHLINKNNPSINIGPGPFTKELNQDFIANNDSIIEIDAKANYLFNLPREIIEDNILTYLAFDPDLANFSEVSKYAKVLVDNCADQILVSQLDSLQPSQLKAFFVDSVFFRKCKYMIPIAMFAVSGGLGMGTSIGFNKLGVLANITNYTTLSTNILDGVNGISTSVSAYILSSIMSNLWAFGLSAGLNSVVGGVVRAIVYSNTVPEAIYNVTKGGCVNVMGSSLGLAAMAGFKKLSLFAENAPKETEELLEKQKLVKAELKNSYFERLYGESEESSVESKNII